MADHDVAIWPGSDGSDGFREAIDDGRPEVDLHALPGAPVGRSPDARTGGTRRDGTGTPEWIDVVADGDQAGWARCDVVDALLGGALDDAEADGETWLIRSAGPSPASWSGPGRCMAFTSALRIHDAPTLPDADEVRAVEGDGFDEATARGGLKGDRLPAIAEHRRRGIGVGADDGHRLGRGDGRGETLESLQEGGADGHGPEHGQEEQGGRGQEQQALRPGLATGDGGIDGGVHARGRQQGQRPAQGAGIGPHGGHPPGTGRAGDEMGLQLARLDGGQVEVEGQGGQFQGAVVAIIEAHGAHAWPSLASRTRRSWTRARQRSVRVAPSVRPMAAAIS